MNWRHWCESCCLGIAPLPFWGGRQRCTRGRCARLLMSQRFDCRRRKLARTRRRPTGGSLQLSGAQGRPRRWRGRNAASGWCWIGRLAVGRWAAALPTWRARLCGRASADTDCHATF